MRCPKWDVAVCHLRRLEWSTGFTTLLYECYHWPWHEVNFQFCWKTNQILWHASSVQRVRPLLSCEHRLYIRFRPSACPYRFDGNQGYHAITSYASSLSKEDTNVNTTQKESRGVTSWHRGCRYWNRSSLPLPTIWCLRSRTSRWKCEGALSNCWIKLTLTVSINVVWANFLTRPDTRAI